MAFPSHSVLKGQPRVRVSVLRFLLRLSRSPRLEGPRFVSPSVDTGCLSFSAQWAFCWRCARSMGPTAGSRARARGGRGRSLPAACGVSAGATGTGSRGTRNVLCPSPLLGARTGAQLRQPRPEEPPGGRWPRPHPVCPLCPQPARATARRRRTTWTSSSWLWPGTVWTSPRARSSTGTWSGRCPGRLGALLLANGGGGRCPEGHGPGPSSPGGGPAHPRLPHHSPTPPPRGTG